MFEQKEMGDQNLWVKGQDIDMQATSANVYPTTSPPPYSDVPQPMHGIPMQTHIVHPPHVAVFPGGATVVQQPTMIPAVVVSNAMGPNSAHIQCKSCQLTIVTRVDRKPTVRTHLFALLLCIFGCWPCVCLPYCMDTCNNADHYCPNCNAYIGSYFS